MNDPETTEQGQEKVETQLVPAEDLVDGSEIEPTHKWGTYIPRGDSD